MWEGGGGGGWFEGNFSVSFGPKPWFKLWIWTWTKLNNMEPLVFGELVVELAEQMMDATMEQEMERTNTFLTQI